EVLPNICEQHLHARTGEPRLAVEFVPELLLRQLRELTRLAVKTLVKPPDRQTDRDGKCQARRRQDSDDQAGAERRNALHRSASLREWDASRMRKQGLCFLRLEEFKELTCLRRDRRFLVNNRQRNGAREVAIRRVPSIDLKDNE